MLRSMKNCDRSARTPARIWSKAESGKPPGLFAVFSMSGGTALIGTAFATRLEPAADIARDFATRLFSNLNRPEAEVPGSPARHAGVSALRVLRSEEHTSELQS